MLVVTKIYLQAQNNYNLNNLHELIRAKDKEPTSETCHTHNQEDKLLELFPRAALDEQTFQSLQAPATANND